MPAVTLSRVGARGRVRSRRRGSGRRYVAAAGSVARPALTGCGRVHRQVVAKDLPDRTVYYDQKNDVTVVLSKTTGKIMSAHRGAP